MYGMNVLVQQPAVQPAVCPVEPGIMQIVQRHDCSQNVCHLHSIVPSGIRHVLDGLMTLRFAIMLRSLYVTLLEPAPT